MNLNPLIKVIIGCPFLIGLWFPFVFAAQTLNPDDGKLIHIHSHQGFFNQKSGKLVYQGNVVATQGTRHLIADKLTIHQNVRGIVSDIKALGMPAKYQYRQASDKQLVYIHANTILYNPKRKLFTFIKNVWFNQSGNIFQGNYSTFNTQTKDIRSKTINHQNTRMILQPFDKKPKERKDVNT